MVKIYCSDKPKTHLQNKTKSNDSSLIFDSIRDTLLTSSFHAVPNITKNYKSPFLVILWIFCWLLALGLCSFYVYDCIFIYLDYDKVTKIDLIHEQPTDFPTVTICNRDSYRFSFDNIIFCRINYDNDCEYNPRKYFEPFIDPFYNECFRFNYRNGIKQSYAGKFNGLWLDLKIDSQEEYNNVVIHIHNRSSRPFSLFNKGLDLSPGRTHYITIQRIFIERLSEPFNNCLDDINQFKGNKSLIKYILNSNISYTQKDCLDICFNLNYIEMNNCSCNSKDLNSVFEKCFTSLDYYTPIWNCTFEFRRNFIQKNLNNKCFDYCPLECNSLNYQLTVSGLDFPTNGNISERDKKNWFDSKYTTYEEVQNSYFSFIIYYEDLNYMLIREAPYQRFSDLVSSIGGVFGVFLGISFLSFVEIVEIIYKLFMHFKE